MLWFAAALLVLAFLYYRLGAQSMPKRESGKQTPPISEAAVPFFGHFFTLKKQSGLFHDFIVEEEARAGGTFWFSMATRPLAISIGADERLSKYILKDKFENYIKPPHAVHRLKELLGEGIFQVDGSEWRSQRKTASMMFSLRFLREDMFPVFVEHANMLRERLQKMQPQQSLDMQEMFHRVTMASFSEIAFGESQRDTYDRDTPTDFSVSFDACQSLLSYRGGDLFWKFKRILNVGRERTIREHIRVVNEYAYNSIDARTKDVNRSSKPDIISRFITTAEVNNTPVDRQYLRDVLMNFIIAGRDTTACTLTWLLYELYEHPEVEQRILEEIASVCADPQKLTYAEAQKLVYVEAVLLETLRLHPAVPIDMKSAVNDDVLPDGTFVPAGASVIYSPYLFGRSEKLWDRPLQFDPARWLNKSDQPSQYKFIAFNAGPRLCLGKSLALLEAKVVISIVLSGVVFDPVDKPINTKRGRSVVLRMEQGLPMRVSPRA